MKKLISIVLLLAVTGWQAFARDDSKPDKSFTTIKRLQQSDETFHPVNVFAAGQKSADPSYGDYITFKINKQSLREFYNANYKSVKFMLHMPDGSSFNLMLTQHESFPNGNTFTYTDESGLHTGTKETGIHYYGIIEGREYSTLATVSLFNTEIICIINDRNHQYNLGCRKDQQDEYVLYDLLTFKLPLNFTCDTQEGNAVERFSSSNVLALPGNYMYIGRIVNVFMDCSYTLYSGTFSSDLNDLTAHLDGVRFNMFVIYDNEGIYLSGGFGSYLHIWTVADPYDYTSTTTALNTFHSYYTNNPGLLPSGTHLKALLNNNTPSGGLGQITAAVFGCGNSSYSGLHGTYDNYPTYSWDVEVVSHEIGHNFGSPHTQACYWNGNCTAIDGCATVEPSCSTCAQAGIPSGGGTIMSYCHQQSVGIDLSLGFWSQPGDTIRNALSRTSCVTNCQATPIINQTVPIAPPNYDAAPGYVLWSSDVITASGTATVVNPVYMVASNSITLSPNFNAPAGSVFEAKISHCTNFNIAASAVRNSSAMSENKLNGIKITPNPFSNNFSLEINLIDNAQVSVAIYDIMGKEVDRVMQNQAQQKGLLQIRYNNEKLKQGIYFCEVYIDGQKYVEKIVKM